MSQEMRRALESLNLNGATLDQGDINILLKKIRSVTPSKLALDLTEMRFLGCECDPLDAMPHHVDFPTSHDLCHLRNRFEAEQWLVINASGGYNFYRHFCYEGERGRLVMRFSFVNENDAVLFKTAWY